MIAALLLLAALDALTAAGEAPLPMHSYVARVLESRELPDETPPSDPNDTVVVTGNRREFEMVFDMVPGLGSDSPAGIRKLSYFSEWEPNFPQYEHVLIFEIEGPSGRYIADGIPVAKTTTGHWAYCIGAEDDSDEELRGLGRPVQLADPIRFRRIGKDRIAPDAHSAMRAGTRACARGIYAEELAEIYAEGEARDRLGR